MREQRRRPTWIAGSVAVVTAAVLMPATADAQTADPQVFINEIHYDNAGTDTGELVEIAAPAGTDLTGWTVELYNGNGGAVYDTLTLSGTVTDAGAGFGFVAVDALGIQNGSPDGVALVDGAGEAVQFLSYEGSFAGVGGAAGGLTSTDIGVAEGTASPVGQSLQLTGTGTTAADFTWTGPGAASPGAANAGQVFETGEPAELLLNELSVNTAGADVEYYELAGEPGTDYTAFSILEIQGIAEGADTPGQVIDVTPVGSTDGGGRQLINLPADTVENDPASFLLVEGFTGAIGDDLDPNDDGTLDSTPWASLADGVSIQSGAGLPYSGTVLDAAFDDATYSGVSAGFAPGGASRLPDGSGDWVRNDFDLAGVTDPGTPEEGEALNTPGAANEAAEPVVVPPEVVAVHEVQGSGPTVALTGPVAVEAVVTSLFEDNDVLDGFFVQEEDADADTDPATSEGIFVFCRGGCPTVATGDLVAVTGTATEFFNMSQIDITTAGSSTTVVSSGNPLPSPVGVDLPAPGRTDAAATFEPVEGMVVSFSDTLVVSEYFALPRFGQVVLTAEERPRQFTDDNPPSVAGYSAFLNDLASRRIILDDADNDQNDPVTGPQSDEPYPYPEGGLSVTNTFRGGDTIDGLTGVLHWSFAGASGTDAWRIRQVPTEEYTFTVANPRPTSPPDVGGDVTVASFNVLNYFTTLDVPGNTCGPSALECRGADSAAELDAQRAKTVSALAAIGADVFGLIEIENDAGAAADDLVAGLNAALGAGTYDAIDTGPIGGDAIKVAFIYRPGSVTPVGGHAILDSSVDPRFIDDANRPALIQTFEAVGSGERFTVALNHLKSKGSACDGDPDLGDGAGNCNQTRDAAAAALVDYLATDPTGSGDDDVLIIGDLNSHAMEDPITTITGAGYTDMVAQFGGDDAYSYVFDGQIGYLDHALANESLAPQVSGTAEWHINADEVPLLDYNDSVRDATEADFERESSALPLYAPDPFRSSDHDPVLIGLDLTGAGPVLACGDVSGTAQQLAAAGWNVVLGNDRINLLNGTSGRDFILAGGGADLVLAGAGDDVVCGGDGSDVLLGGRGNDRIFGQAGDDVLTGEAGSDRCDGGPHRLLDVAFSCEQRIGIP